MIERHLLETRAAQDSAQAYQRQTDQCGGIRAVDRLAQRNAKPLALESARAEREGDRSRQAIQAGERLVGRSRKTKVSI